MPDAAVPDPLRGLAVDHVAIAVRELGDASPWDALGLPRLGPDEVVASEGVVVRVHGAGDALVELIAPLDAESGLLRFLERRGPGLHHLALRVPDVAAAIAALSERGATFVGEAPRPGRGGSRIAFVHPSFTGGTLLELVEHA